MKILDAQDDKIGICNFTKKTNMPEVSRFYGIIIAFYYNEHNPPHFHAKYGEFRAEVDIRTLQILNGDLPKRAKSMVLEWADEHRNELMHNWELARQNNELNAIEPLK
jgi:phosphomannomutase